jgi:diguanylate cyclase (GGDEF)-like protein
MNQREPATFRVLVVDDTRGIHDDFRKILTPTPAKSSLDDLESELFETAPSATRRDGFVIDSAYQGLEAVRMVEAAVARGEPYAVAFVDVRMPPGIDGVETLARIWKVDPRVQAVICTAYSDYAWEDIIAALGHSDGMVILRKPFDAVEVLQLGHALAQKWVLQRRVEQQLSELEAEVAQRTRALEETNDRLRSEIDQRRVAEADLRHHATHDSLTGLPNRILLRDRVEQAMARSRRSSEPFALMLLDLDGFKEVNDRHDHAAGDALLRVVAERLTQCTRASDTVARLGGDEFVILAEVKQGSAGAVVLAERLLSALDAPIDVFGHSLRTPASIGIALFPADCADAESLLKSADLAMYEAKRCGRGTYRFFARDMIMRSTEELQLREQLELALERDELRLWYQPVTDLATGAIGGMEALVRWQHPMLGLVPPMTFIPAAEASGLMVPIGTWVLREACRQLAAWRSNGVGLSMAVNVSALQLAAAGFVELVEETLAAHALDPSWLELEITETAAMQSVEPARAALVRLAKTGVRVVIDDFGSGYSSLVRLHELPVHAVKIDRFFIKDMVDDARAAAIVQGIIALSHSLGLQVVAEGIETVAQLELLHALDASRPRQTWCERAQGFLFSKPLPADAATTLLRRQAGDRQPHSVAKAG